MGKIEVKNGQRVITRDAPDYTGHLKVKTQRISKKSILSYSEPSVLEAGNFSLKFEKKS